MLPLRRALPAVLVASLVTIPTGHLVGCSGPDGFAPIAQDDASVELDGATSSIPDGGTPSPDATSDAAPDAPASEPPIDPPPGPALVSARTTCPTAFRTTVPTAGMNTGFVVSGQSRSFQVLLPPATFTGPRPLFVGFHGTGGTGPGFASAAKLADFAARGFVVLAPSGNGNGSLYPVWDALRKPGTEAEPNADLAFFDALVGCTASHFAIDSTRVFVGGYSAGGIITNAILRSRSSVVAGGIPSSGVFTLTAPANAPPPSDLFVVVAWGGSNDKFGDLAFAEEASLASRYYESLPSVNQIACRGAEVGHRWLTELNRWYIDSLLTHPKGASHAPNLPVPAGVPVTCDVAAATIAPLPPITCGTSARAGCRELCQRMADCVGENHTSGSALESELVTAGIVGTSCGGCIAKCQASATSAQNTAALTCFAAQTATCGEGVAGGMPFMDAINACCAGRTGSTLCFDLCDNFGRNSFAATGFLPACKPFLP